MNATVTPLSSKAKNRLANSMNNNPMVTIEQIKDEMVFFVAQNGVYCTWANLDDGPDWQITLLP
jgi:hypothetical protein